MVSIPTPIIRRRVNIPFDPANARGWHLDRKEVEDFLNAVSFVFPPGEKFFIQSVQNYQSRIVDPVLQDQVKRFIYQEAMHTKEHIRCNEALSETYPNGPRIEKFTKGMLFLARHLTPKSTQLAFTCALEHFTAILADGLLRSQEPFLAKSDPAFASLWLWHAVEEAEHKAVCFDVYQQVVGKGVFSYLHRVAAMFVQTTCFTLTMGVAYLLLKKGEKHRELDSSSDAQSSNKTLTKRSFWFLLNQLISPRLYFDYYRYSFHPWDHDNSPQILEWKQRYKGFGAGPDADLSEATT